jgi:transcriptional regulator with GAF, ATPase, and Fis domain
MDYSSPHSESSRRVARDERLWTVRSRFARSKAWSLADAVLWCMAWVVMGYSGVVLWRVATMGDIGLRCVLGTDLEEEVAPDFAWKPVKPNKGAHLVEVAGQPVTLYTQYVEALRKLNERVNQPVLVRWRSATGGPEQSAVALVKRRPFRTYVWSLVWFLQEMVIFVVGARVFWKRPRDDSARLFFWLCIVTVGAFMGGYHWSEIVVDPPLIFLFAAFAVFVPVVSLHFYLVFPRPNPILILYRQRVLALLYGLPTAYLAALWGLMGLARYYHHETAPIVATILHWIGNLALGYIALAVVIFVLCISCLTYSFLKARTRAERNQVRWIWLASLLALPPIGYLLWEAVDDPATLGLDRAAWPMFIVSLFYTMAYALSITRYKLMQVEAIINRSVVYFALSVVAGLVYALFLMVSGLIIGPSLTDNPTTRGTLVAAATAILILLLSEAARRGFQKVLDRRFYREKYKFDQAMRQMSQAVGSLVDRATLSRRLLEAAAEVMRLEWGAIYLADGAPDQLRLVACVGPAPDERDLTTANPLVARLQETPTIRVPHAMAPATASDPATDAMIRLGGEVANALEGADGALAGLLVLGPKRSGMPFEDEEIAFLGALSSVATLALRSAEIQGTLEGLNRELRDRADKIAEQQRRILILQDQLLERGEMGGEPAEPAAASKVFDEIKGTSRSVRQMLAVARKVAASPSAVLIRGESGTGKELLAEAIHAASPRAAGPFVKVHCAALSQSLLESELFGHVKGAFTGADRDRIGRFEQAHGGTLFLDEIGDISLEVQTKLLRVLQEMTFERVGSSQPISVDVRIVAATHQDIEALIRAGRFREDLFYRLNVIPIQTPPLRERKDDIFELAVHFLGRHAQRVGKAVTHLDDEAIEALMAYDWPGNIRELENVIERAVVLADGPAITVEDLPVEIRRPGRRRLRAVVPAAASRAAALRPSVRDGPSASASAPPVDVLDAEVEAYERQRLRDALQEARGNKSEAARLLGMPRSTFVSKLKKHGLT